MVITKIVFSLIFFESVTLEIHVAIPFSNRVSRDFERLQAFLLENAFVLDFFFFFFWGGGGWWKIGTKRTSMGAAWVSSVTTGWVKK